MLVLAAALLFALGLAHSVLGERYILVRLFRRTDLPKLFGGTSFTTGTLRFAWHLTTIAWWAFAWLILLAARRPLGSADVLRTAAVGCAVSGLFPIGFTRGRHLSWIVFFAAAVLLWFGAGAAGP